MKNMMAFKGIIEDCEDISLELGFHFTYLFSLLLPCVFIHVQCQMSVTKPLDSGTDAELSKW